MSWNIVAEFNSMRGARRRLVVRGAGIIFMIFILFYLTTYFGYIHRVKPEFWKIQQSEISAQKHILNQLVTNEHKSLATSVADWGYWDLPYAFIDGTNPSFPEENITIEALNNLQVQILILINKQKEIMAGMYLSPQNELETTMPGDLQAYLDADTWYRDAAEGVSGVVRLSDQYVFVAAYPVSDPLQPDNPANGWILMGRYLNSELIEKWEAFGSMDIYLDEHAEAEEGEVEKLTGAKLYPVELVDVLGEEVGSISVVNRNVILSAAENLSQVISLISLVVVLIFNVVVVGLWVRVNLSDEKRQALVQQSMAVVQDQNKKLQLAQDQLSSKVAEVTLQAKEMEDTKAAMLNLLDDGRELENQLKIEKEGVERKVAERTRDLELAKKQLTDSWLEQQQEKARLLASINGLSMGFVLTNDKAEVILSNTAVNQVLHCQKAEWTMPELVEIFSNSFDIKSMWQSCFDQKKQIQEPEILVGNKYVRVLTTPVLMNNGYDQSIIGVVILIEDIDEAKQLQKSRDEFFAVASHELRTPLTAIRGNMSLFKDYFPQLLENPEVKQMVEDTHTASVRLIAIVNDFLDASRLELKKMVFKPEDFEINLLAGQVMKEMQATASEKSLGWEWQAVSPETLKVRADRNRTEQVLLNLLGNAQKFTSAGKVRMELVVEGKVLKVKVIDTGKGISADQQELLFKKFQQTNTSVYTRDVSGGTGLGLYVSRLLAEGMGGKLYLERSEPNSGSTFCLELPVADG